MEYFRFQCVTEIYANMLVICKDSGNELFNYNADYSLSVTVHFRILSLIEEYKSSIKEDLKIFKCIENKILEVSYSSILFELSYLIEVLSII